MSQISFDANALNSIINKAKASVKDSETPRTAYAPVAYFGPGKHKLRLFIDPVGELMRDLLMHQNRGKKCLCPRFLDRKLHPETAELETDDKGNNICEICQIGWDVDNWRSKIGVRKNLALYGHLYETDKASDYWEPNTSYLIIAKTKLKTAIISFLESLAKDAPDYVLTMLNPHNAGPFVTIEVTGGTQGTVNITPIPGASKPPIELGDWYRPLKDSYIPEQFSISSYKDVLEVAKEVAKEFEGVPNPDHEEAPAEGADGAAAPSNETVHHDAAGNQLPQTPIGEVQQSFTESQPAAETAAPVTGASPTVASQVAPHVSQASSGLQTNQVITRTNRVVTLPQDVVDRQCWTKQNNQDPKCVICPINLECMYESASVG